MSDPEPPFPRHRLYYVVLKLVVIAAALAIGLKLVGYW